MSNVNINFLLRLCNVQCSLQAVLFQSAPLNNFMWFWISVNITLRSKKERHSQSKPLVSGFRISGMQHVILGSRMLHPLCTRNRNALNKNDITEAHREWKLQVLSETTTENELWLWFMSFNSLTVFYGLWMTLDILSCLVIIALANMHACHACILFWIILSIIFFDKKTVQRLRMSLAWLFLFEKGRNPSYLVQHQSSVLGYRNWLHHHVYCPRIQHRFVCFIRSAREKIKLNTVTERVLYNVRLHLISPRRTFFSVRDARNKRYINRPA